LADEGLARLSSSRTARKLSCSFDTSKLTFLRSLPKVFKGTHLDSPYAHVMRGRRIELKSDRPFVIYADGDPIGATPATVTVEPRCLRVVVPPATT